MKIKINKIFQNTNDIKNQNNTNNLNKIIKNNKQVKRSKSKEKIDYSNYIMKNANNNVKYHRNTTLFKFKRQEPKNQINDLQNNNVKVKNQKRVRLGNTKNSNIILNRTKNLSTDSRNTHIFTFNLKRQFNNLFKNKNKLSKAYYFLLFAMVCLGAGSMYLVNKTYKLTNQEDYAVYSEDDYQEGVSVSSSVSNDNTTNVKDTKQEQETPKVNNTTTTNNNTSVKKESTNKTSSQPVKKVEPLSFTKPLTGDISKMYSLDKVIYSKTLELWKTHDGIDILATIGQSVKSIEKGTIQKVYDDSFYGTTIVIDHGQGYVSSYSNLDTQVNVKEKQIVKKGQVIGKISNTAIGEIKDDSHLHFMLFKDNQNVDPTNIFK